MFGTKGHLVLAYGVLGNIKINKITKIVNE